MSTGAATLTQDNRPIGVTASSLGKDKLLLEQFSVSEGLSRPFRISLSLLGAPDYTLAFEKLLGQSVTVRLDVPGGGETRYFNGVVYKLTEGSKVHSPDTGKFLTRYWAEVMPSFVKLRSQVRSRIFQHLSVPDILKKVLTGINVKWEIKAAFEPRDYCVQYHESDFQFASRLMEEEGIFYFFKHTDSDHTMVVADDAGSFANIPGKSAKIVFNDFKGLRDATLHEDRVVRWQKSQEMKSGKYRLWDHCFELPAKNLEATEPILATAAVGTVTHHLKVGGNDQWEIYDFPGDYAGRFDGIDKGGSPQPSELSKIEQDNTRTVKIRMEQVAANGLMIDGEGNVRRFIAGYKFQLDKHFNANGTYVLTDVDHVASMEGTYTSNESVPLRYKNTFRCIPTAVPFRPQQVTPKPTIGGTQTAVVVGPAGGEISTDKYGRVKVQFFWDREGKKDLDSSCWVRVAQAWAGKSFGAFFLPRVGDEVIVAFLEGDPDQPIIVGCVYNADHMPAYTLPDNKTRNYVKTRSTEKGTAENFNELRFEDKKDSEEVYFHAEKDFNRVVENNDTLKVGFDKKDKGDQTIDVYNDRTATLDQGNETLTVKKGTRTTTVQKDDTHEVKDGARIVTVQKDDTHTVKQGDLSVTVNMGNASYTISQGKCTIEAMQSIELKVGATSIKLTPTGVTIQSTMIKLQADGMLQSKGGFIKVAADAMLDMKGGMVKIN
ncbi:MAG TPA: type VI secretion system tip protein TssI/VgrG [Pirellulales bacterium]|nr:type VI secretion system tip protein TssI/VgrG [Pirellulales bacterium]